MGAGKLADPYDVSEQTKATQGPTPLRQQQHNEKPMTTLARQGGLSLRKATACLGKSHKRTLHKLTRILIGGGQGALAGPPREVVTKLGGEQGRRRSAKGYPPYTRNQLRTSPRHIDMARRGNGVGVGGGMCAARAHTLAYANTHKRTIRHPQTEGCDKEWLFGIRTRSPLKWRSCLPPLNSILETTRKIAAAPLKPSVSGISAALGYALLTVNHLTPTGVLFTCNMNAYAATEIDLAQYGSYEADILEALLRLTCFECPAPLTPGEPGCESPSSPAQPRSGSSGSSVGNPVRRVFKQPDVKPEEARLWRCGEGGLKIAPERDGTKDAACENACKLKGARERGSEGPGIVACRGILRGKGERERMRCREVAWEWKEEDKSSVEEARGGFLNLKSDIDLRSVEFRPRIATHAGAHGGDADWRGGREKRMPRVFSETAEAHQWSCSVLHAYQGRAKPGQAGPGSFSPRNGMLRPPSSSSSSPSHRRRSCHPTPTSLHARRAPAVFPRHNRGGAGGHSLTGHAYIGVYMSSAHD
ncbi:unnamed protein product [Pleuronectes platessa]|uniref:Uncharacterized protein n=1 Tax=Pleuronectes platessa TaxID=8262 RepID=A0A9N7YZC1_PLEPL|nr:unnamed protein product [Pleuronectes platessa]